MASLWDTASVTVRYIVANVLDWSFALVPLYWIRRCCKNYTTLCKKQKEAASRER